MKYQPPFVPGATPGAPGIFNADPNAAYINGDPLTATEGSYFPNAAIEHPQREIVKVITEAGLTPDHADLTQLWQALRTWFGSSPMFPEITVAGAVMAVTAGTTGELTISAAQTWLHRGWRKFTTDDFALANLQFTTIANSTYHLRWYAPGHANAPVGTWPKGRFMLRALADSTDYNPTVAAETDLAFDSTFDDMLVAKVVTNGANAVTATSLVNRMRLASEVAKTTHTFSYALTEVGPDVAPTYTLNWARTPQIAWRVFKVGAATGYVADGITNVFFYRSRYTARPMVIGFFTSPTFSETGTIDGVYEALIYA